MNINIKKIQLIKHLTKVTTIIEKKIGYPSLAHVLFIGKGKKIQLVCSNLSAELSTTFLIDSEIKEECRFLIPAIKLLDLCRNMQDDKISLNFTTSEKAKARETLKITSSNGKFTLATLEVSQFPRINFEKVQEYIELSTQSLMKAVEYTKNFISPEASRTVLQGAYFEVVGNNLSTVATDGHRMACFRCETDKGVKQAQFIFPKRVVSELVQHINEEEGKKCRISCNDGYARVECGDFTITTRLLEGKYPDYQTVIPEESGNYAVISSEELSTGLKAIRVLASESTHSVLCEFSKGKLKLKTHNSETGEGECDIPQKYTGDEINIVFNIKYLFDVLASIKSPSIKIYIKDGSKSCLIVKNQEKKDEKADNVRFVVMPMRI